MRDFRLVMVSTESDYSFVIYEKAVNQSAAIEEANTQYRPHFEVDLWSVTEVMK